MLEHSAFTQNAPNERKGKGIDLPLKTKDMTWRQRLKQKVL